MSKRLGLERAEKLKTAILKELRQRDGTFIYFKHGDGLKDNTYHTLAAAFPVLTELVTGFEAKEAIRAIPFKAYGFPLFTPWVHNDDTYHNHSSWPFSDAFVFLAREKALGVDEGPRSYAHLARTFSDKKEAFMEVCRIHDRPGQLNVYDMSGKRAQLWIVAGFLGRALKSGKVTGMEALPSLQDYMDAKKN